MQPHRECERLAGSRSRRGQLDERMNARVACLHETGPWLKGDLASSQGQCRHILQAAQVADRDEQRRVTPAAGRVWRPVSLPRKGETAPAGEGGMVQAEPGGGGAAPLRAETGADGERIGQKQ